MDVPVVIISLVVSRNVSRCLLEFEEAVDASQEVRNRAEKQPDREVWHHALLLSNHNS